jgi:signal peptidase I
MIILPIMGKAIAGAFIAGLFMKIFIFDFMIAQGDSMSPAIRSGTILLVNRLQYGFRAPLEDRYLFRWADPKPGDVVVFRTPLGDTAVKRIDALTSSGYLIMLGDNSRLSLDSRSYGPVHSAGIIGKVLGIK